MENKSVLMKHMFTVIGLSKLIVATDRFAMRMIKIAIDCSYVAILQMCFDTVNKTNIIIYCTVL